MKKILSIALCLVLILSLGTTAYAADTITGGQSQTVTGNYQAAAEAGTVYSVEIQWGSLEFTYEVPAQVWDTETHTYKSPDDATPQWVCKTDEDETTVDANEVRVVNRSNAGIDVTVTTDMGESGITATVSDEGKFTLASADATITAENATGQETKGSVTITLEGELSKEHTAGGTIGTVTVTLAAAQTGTETTAPEPENPENNG